MNRDNFILGAALVILGALVLAPQERTPETSGGSERGGLAADAVPGTETELESLVIDGERWELIDTVRACSEEENYRIRYGAVGGLEPGTPVTLEQGERCRYQAP
ncbi:MAG: hypothetical protein U5L04_02235 [Trueperaceae bacterium]|nr:hypothetical protein [Trueperaceae bacterium]